MPRKLKKPNLVAEFLVISSTAVSEGIPLEKTILNLISDIAESQEHLDDQISRLKKLIHSDAE